MSHDTTTNPGKAAVMLAADKGAKIECKRRDSANENWEWAPEPWWNWYQYDYRVSPEPLTVWVNIYLDGIGGCYESLKEAMAAGGQSRIRSAKFVEVIE